MKLKIPNRLRRRYIFYQALENYRATYFILSQMITQKIKNFSAIGGLGFFTSVREVRKKKIIFKILLILSKNKNRIRSTQ